MSMVDNSLRVTDMGLLQQTETVQRTRIETSNEFGGIKLEKSTPQPRNDRPEPAPELKELRELAPYIANSETVVPKPGVKYDPEGPLMQLWNSVDGLRDSNPTLFKRCERAMVDIENGFSLLKSPPEYDTRDHAQQLKAQVELLKDMSTGMFGKGEGSDVMIGGENGDVPLGPQIKRMLDETAKELEDYSNYVGNMPDPRPTMESVGHFKSLETLGAARTLEPYIDKKREQIDQVVSGFVVNNGVHVNSSRVVEMSDLEIDQMFGGVFEPDVIQTLKDNRDGLKLLLHTKDQLDSRHARFSGKVGNEFTSTEPLDKDGLKEAMGKKDKPNFFARLFRTIAGSTFVRAMSNMTRDIRQGGMPPMTSSYLSESKMMTKLLGERLKQAGFDGISQKDLSHDIEHNHVKSLGEDQDWDKIEKDVHLVIDGQNRSFKSTLTPHNELGTTNSPGVSKGVCCHDGESKMPVNMWQSELKDENGNTLFCQLRTGVNCAYEIEDESERKMVNLGRARDMLETHVKTHPGVQDQLEDGLGSQDNPIVLRNLWVSHLTPDIIRPYILMKGQNENELMMSREQNEAMQTLAGMRQFTVGEGEQQRQIWVKYEPIMFSMGVNVGAVGGAGGIVGNWGTAKSEFNEPSMEMLLGRDGMKGGEFGGWVKDGLDTNNRRIEVLHTEMNELANDLEFDDEELDQNVVQQKQNRIGELREEIDRLRGSNERIEALAQQVQDLWSSGDYQKSGEDPYKMSSRLGVLGYELGCAITSNCKSNKDRNSYGDVHMKDLSIQMHTKGEIRGPNEPRTREEQLNLRTLTRESGNHELQKLNVGGAGYKLEHVARVFQAQGLPIDDPGFYGFGKFTAT
jgi:hypothetical protein